MAFHMEALIGLSLTALTCAAVYFAVKDETIRNAPPIDSELDVDNEAVDEISAILKKHRALKMHRTIVDSMTLMVYQRERGDANLDELIPPESHDIVETGRMYVEKYVNNPSEFDCFAAGVIEKELNAVRVGSLVPVQDVYSMRKFVDVFYYKLNKTRSSIL
jgi:hypothetical protein